MKNAVPRVLHFFVVILSILIIYFETIANIYIMLGICYANMLYLIITYVPAGRNIMKMYDLLLISLALSLDAFGVAISVGLDKEIRFGNKLGFIISFGFFQFLFSIIGAYAGVFFNTYIAAVPKIIGGVLIAIVGALMIKEGFGNKEEDILLSFKTYIILGISVSIDAMIIGFTVLNNIKNDILILNYTLFIGVTTLIVSSVGFIIAKYLRKIEVVSKYADYIGGIILIIFGIKMIFS